MHNEEETVTSKCLDNNEKATEQNVEKSLTDSELNALAAKHIKAELMGNTVSNIMLAILNNYAFGSKHYKYITYF